MKLILLTHIALFVWKQLLTTFGTLEGKHAVFTCTHVIYRKKKRAPLLLLAIVPIISVLLYYEISISKALIQSPSFPFYFYLLYVFSLIFEKNFFFTLYFFLMKERFLNWHKLNLKIFSFIRSFSGSIGQYTARTIVKWPVGQYFSLSIYLMAMRVKEKSSPV